LKFGRTDRGSRYPALAQAATAETCHVRFLTLKPGERVLLNDRKRTRDDANNHIAGVAALTVQGTVRQTGMRDAFDKAVPAVAGMTGLVLQEA